MPTQQHATPSPPPGLPARWTDPAPVLAAGTVLFLVAAILCTVVDSWSGAAPTCWAGTVLGALGFGLFALQRRAARSGRRTAQKGLVAPPDASDV
ncbi:hypothetical protein ASG56_04310 [Rhodococcus sp. Leaf7]|uniref:DUF2530 domain-containing protein n=1 Tax=unclassified Rhodococcus (in: high G+C Gram-positive bacteria) TaxID=192944 RepID=UPI0006FD4F02|nr:MULTISPECIES: DUF2530 domain-containing protein [unclassified Rhodococcus (in: high G+C Gram-positive bacteria)]KQU07820.1 hypothetical protein ASG56_04310 [Rhodococcus sp. Leaf7]KQU43338.1 hypothetical protein ASG64_04310 [Rhodococcus sp. Leaf247]